MLDELVEKRLIVWSLEVPTTGGPPEELLRAELERLPAGEPRRRATAALAALEAGRDQVSAAAGDADRLGIGLEPAELGDLVALAEHAPDSPDAEDGFRARIRAWHVDLQTSLWADREATGKAYELGSFLSDTSNRVVLELRRTGDPCAHVTRELREVFSARRVERVKRLLDDLQTRIDPAAVRIVKQHLDCWQSAVGDRTAKCTTRADLEPLDSQAITWFQLVSGDKEPEAYIDHDDRAHLRNAMVARTMRAYVRSWRCWATAVLMLAATAALAYLLVAQKATAAQIFAVAGPIAGALGISLASLGRTVRQSLDVRAELLWNTALVEVISARTLCIDELLPEPQTRPAWLAPVSTPRRASRLSRAGRTA